MHETLVSERFRVADSLEAINSLFYSRGWTDGLPIFPPTEARVRQMLSGSDRDPQEVVGSIMPKRGKATVEKIAINAVMAGCLPSYLPAVITAVEAISDEQFNLYGLQVTTSPATPLIIVNGPIAERLDINSGYNVFGQGWRANATIGRAVRLVMINVGGGTPGILDRSTQGQPGKYTFCVAENESASPWEPLHVELGLSPEDSAVTVVGVSSVVNVADLGSRTADGLLKMIVNSIKIAGLNHWPLGGAPAIALCPEHAQLLDRHGYKKADVKLFIHQHARLPLSAFSPENAELIEKSWAERYGAFTEDTLLTMAEKAEDILIVVVGGSGAQSSFLPTFGDTRAVTRPVSALGKEGKEWQS